MRIAIRGFASGVRCFEDVVDYDDEQLSRLLPDLAAKHANALASHALHMIEIEFVDEPDEKERYFRFGSDPGGMVQPIRVDLSRPS